MDISLTLAEAACQELRVERRSVFRVVLPDKKNVGVKAKLHRSVGDVLYPILLKYGYPIEDYLITQVSTAFYIPLTPEE